jgi:hypothetical protein
MSSAIRTFAERIHAHLLHLGKLHIMPARYGSTSDLLNVRIARVL